ncbi:DUF937 domain-containing protein [Riemerella columbina]|uniref:DUF937 domain-containing protein n=1 Tax=Riemerella columbina TaxID=103810 RepID=UPI0003642042|nr:DUF937 domain-containing protein [Riemerella columbina]
MNIIDLIKGQFGHGVIAQLASQLGENETHTSKAVNAFIPTVLAGMVAQSDKSLLLKEVTNLADTNVLTKLSQNSPESNEILSGILSMVYGDKIDSLMSGVASFADIKSSSSAALLGFTTLTSLATVGRYAKDQTLDAQGLKHLLDKEKTNVSNLLPAGFSLAAVGLGHAEQFLHNAKDKVSDFAHDMGDKISDTAHDAKENLEDFTENAKEKFNEVSEDVKETVSEKYEEAKDYVSEKAEAVKDKFHQAEEKTKEKLNDDQEPVSIWKWLIPLVLLLLMGWFAWKLMNKKEPKVEDVDLAYPTDTIKTVDSINQTTTDTLTIK